uniref:GH16 domain-containing protein n=1 Tax=Acrobeloides nanus TaxID=290746 RepID=A0A914D5N8_9BILA
MIFNLIKSFYFISIITYFCERVSAQSGPCIKTYTDLAINGNDLNGVQGSSSLCCQLCQQKRGCLAYTWDNFNGGTCWLKSDTQPLYSKNGSISGLMLPDSTHTYSLNKTYSGPNFFNDWIFEGGGGNVADWVNESLARDLGIIGYQNNSVYIAVDHTNVIPNNSWWGRPTIRIQSKYLYNSGLFVLNMNHMPTGPGTWPAFWTYGPHWPNNGEIDILEGVYAMDYDQITLHVGEGCTMRHNDSQFFTGKYVDDKGSNGELKQVLDCYQYSKSRVDHANIIPNTSSKGRPTTRIQSKYLYNSGLFILNLNHMPSGNGTYPSFWTYGPSWPNNGEIDILEGVYAMDYDQITLHVGDGCTMQYNDSLFFTGRYVDDKDSTGQYKQVLNCYQYSKSSMSLSAFFVNIQD